MMKFRIFAIIALKNEFLMQRVILLMSDLYDALEMNLNDWHILFANWGEQKFRANQICQWI